MAPRGQKLAARQHLTFSQEHVPARLAASTTAQMSGAFLPAGNQALEADSMVVAAAFMAVVEAGTGKRMCAGKEIVEKF